jgi:hypothetical protein
MRFVFVGRAKSVQGVLKGRSNQVYQRSIMYRRLGGIPLQIRSATQRQ